MNTITTILCLALSFAMIGMNTPDCVAYAQVLSTDDKAASAVRRLWSGVEADRADAKLELLEIGSAAIPPLLALLRDILSRPAANRFVTGSEADGEEAMLRYDTGIREPNGLELEITGRLEDDSCELLGRLGAVDAVPLLVRMVERRDFFTQIASMTTEMRALMNIGPKAQPDLIEALQMADATAASIRFGGSQPTQQERNRFNRAEAAKIRARAARVLGEIGDQRALAVLESALEHTDEPDSWRPDKPFIEGAIKQIKERNRLKVQQ